MNSFHNKLGQRGFTIVEIMVALSLIVLIFALIPSASNDREHAKIQETLNDFDRAVRFAENESILRNVIVRIRINLDETPQKYTVEYGQSPNLILPEQKDLSRLSLKDREKEEARSKKLSSQFATVDELFNEDKEIDESLKVYGIATSYYQNLITEGEVSIYFYPTGEKDNALIILSNEYEVATLDIPPFENVTRDDYHPFSELELENPDDSAETKAREVFQQWLK